MFFKIQQSLFLACGELVESACGELVESACGELVESACGELVESIRYSFSLQA
jgi:hypothetical protein